MRVERTDEEKILETRIQSKSSGVRKESAPPPLKRGDRLTRAEFERRYEAMPHTRKAELIEGVVYMPSPVRVDIHGEPHAEVMTWLGVYRVATPGVRFADNATVRLDLDNEPQPDALLRIEPVHGGRSRIDASGYVEGAPELIVEIAGTSADYDLNEKLGAYRRNGVQEYIVWRTQDEQLDWFGLVEGEYVPLAPDSDGVIHSQVFPGLRLAVKALIDGALTTVLSELHKGLETIEHARFVERLSNI